MVAQNDEEFKTILDYEVKAKVNGEDVRIINKCELKKLEPHLEVCFNSFFKLLFLSNEKNEHTELLFRKFRFLAISLWQKSENVRIL